jgi:uncharacterized protein YegP (UPF0339 family)
MFESIWLWWHDRRFNYSKVVDNAALQAEASRHEKAKKCVLQIFKDKKDEFRWRLRAANNKIIAEGAEGYKKKQGLEKSLFLVMDIMDIVKVDDQT